MKFELGKKERLKHKQDIELLFLEGEQVQKFPLKLIYIKEEACENPGVRIAFSVPKRKIKLAVNRNRIKRMMRDIYRLNKEKFQESLEGDLKAMLIYTANEEKPYIELERSFNSLLQKFVKQEKNVPKNQ